MLYHIETEERMAGHHSGTVYRLYRTNIGSEIEVWVDHGFNCLSWKVAGRELLFKAPDWETNPQPTRSGIPILFPFPNRISDGKFKHREQDYELPKNDSTQKNAIHGFAAKRPWYVFGYGSDSESAWIHGDFQISKNAAEMANHWPSDALVSVIYRLHNNSLRIESTVRNLGAESLPFGMGYHPYFRLPLLQNDIGNYTLYSPARSIWELDESLPTGKKLPVPDELNWNRPRMIGSTKLDTLYGDLGVIRDVDGLLLRAELGSADSREKFEVWTSTDFRESVLFTPPHRQAVCIEPYTCATDAVNLSDRKIDAGWKVLEPGKSWSGVVEFRWVESD